MKAILAALMFSPFLVSCAEFAALVTTATPVIPRPLTKSERGEFATHREFVTLEPMWFVVSTKSIISSDEIKFYGSQSTPESRILIPRGTRVSVTRFVEEGYIDPNWVNQKSLLLYGSLDFGTKTLKGVMLNAITVWPNNIPSYNRNLVALVPEER